MKVYLVAVNLLVHAYHNPESTIADALEGILTPGMPKHAGANSALVDGAVAGDDIASSIAAVSLRDDDTPDESAFPLVACGDGAMIDPPDQRILLARMAAAHAETQRQLGIIERQIAARAERLTITDRAKRRQHGRSASSWTKADERLFQQHVAELALARRGEIDALTCKLDRQETAIAEFRTRNRDSAAAVRGEGHRHSEHRRRPRTLAGVVEFGGLA